MILGTHNSMSYLSPVKWYFKPFALWAKCQSKTLNEQIEKGVQYFDFRIRFDSKGEPYFCHGLMKYKICCALTVLDCIKKIALYSGNKRMYIRIMLETTSIQSKKYRENQVKLFSKYIEYLIKSCSKYPNLYLKFDKKYPYVVDDTWWCSGTSEVYSPITCEIFKHFDIKWHSILPPYFWKFIQKYTLKCLKDIKYTDIVSQDFI